jgi:hypothetical protein
VAGGLCAVAVVGCGSDEADGPPVITDRVLADSLALEANDRFEQRGHFGTRVGDEGGRCRGRDARWECTLEIAVNDQIRDRRVYAVAVKRDGCWTARQTGTDVGKTGKPAKPSNPDLLRGCVES